MKEANYLKGTLKKGLWPRYCLESIWGGYDFALPMLCFCDIPLSQIVKHMESYGDYGIGVTKEWAEKNNCTPVFYIDNENTLKKNMTNILERLYNRENVSVYEYKVLAYIKKVEGYYKDEESWDKKKRRFYDEKEWRYVPFKDKIKKRLFVMKDDECKSFDKNIASEYNENNRVVLDVSDIAYIIVPDEPFRLEIIDYIKSEGIGRDEEERYILISKILTKQQIIEDF